MILLMWLGRLEIIPVVVLLTRHYWRGLALSYEAPRSAPRKSAAAVVGNDGEHLVARPHHGRRLDELRPALTPHGDEARTRRKREPACLLPRDGRVALDLHLDHDESLLLQLEQAHEPVLGHLVLDQTEDAGRGADRLRDSEQVEVLLVAGSFTRAMALRTP